ncbi:HAMP domain-containing sensor histidine kinase [Uliginosibacterium sp. TH139]|uniref:sensor histidine kinase n=1 Tax=Uliginosibacterium sp. TH139 TaxID=2067453 RepID=UPI000C7B65A7|nr:HAMP domain-containing sensor histidine kinase [Uliginosibacterium sp. TH139]PLK47694.1 sensor histidine kinase [Uliginosibacterium sp. TH139]
MSWVERIIRLIETSTFRHAALSAFVFLLMAFGSMLLSSHQIESLLLDHVHGLVLSDIQEQERKTLSDSQTLASRLNRDLPHEKDDKIALVLGPDGTVLYGTQSLRQAVARNQAPATGWRNLSIQGTNTPPMRVVGMQLQLADGGIFLSAFNVLPMLERVRVIPIVAGSGLFAVLLSSLAIGLYSSLRSMRRVDRIRSALRAYVGGEREVTVPASPNGDEFDLLGMDINNVLARISLLMDEVKSVSSHLAHELRTPLTRLHNRLESAAERVDSELRDDILAAVEEAERIQRMFKAVLRIGEIEAGRCAHSFEWFEARGLLGDVIDYYQPLAESSGITLRQEACAGCKLFGDRALLFQALANLLENALKYAGEHASITLLARLRDGCVEIGVADDGPGIPPDQRGEAVKRFRRLHGSERSGSGLGLALVNAIAKLHSGVLLLEDNPPCGLLAALRLARNHWDEERAGLIDALRS